MLTIPKQTSHTFCNASETDELAVEFVLEPSMREQDEEFFSVFD
jgi:hypothetical protein